MKLTTGQTPWHALHKGKFPAYPRLENDISCDVLVIGGGLSGSLAAYVLSAQGADVVLLEQQMIGSGSTSANTGLLQFMNDESLSELIGRYGEEKGVAFYRMCGQALDRLESISAELPVDAGFKRRSSLYYASSEKDAGLIRHEYDVLLRHGFDVEYWERDRIRSAFPFSKPAAIYSQNDAELNPYLAVLGLIARASSHGLRVYEHSGVERMEHDSDGVAAHTSFGRVKANKVIWATGYTAQEWKPDKVAELAYTYAIMTGPVPDLSFWHEQALIWETSRPYLYLRTTPDNRIIVGGLDDPYPPGKSPGQLLPSRSDELVSQLCGLFPSLEQVYADFSWGGVFGYTRDGLPLIGRDERFPHSYFIEGYGGNGTVYSMIAADMLAEAIAGREPRELAWLAPARLQQG